MQDFTFLLWCITSIFFHIHTQVIRWCSFFWLSSSCLGLSSHSNPSWPHQSSEQYDIGISFFFLFRNIELHEEEPKSDDLYIYLWLYLCSSVEEHYFFIHQTGVSLDIDWRRTHACNPFSVGCRLSASVANLAEIDSIQHMHDRWFNASSWSSSFRLLLFPMHPVDQSHKPQAVN